MSRDARFFGREDAMVALGVGKNMVQSIRHWGLVTGVLHEVPGSRGRELEVADLGRWLFLDEKWDPFLEDPATLWLLHWQIASTFERATTWYWAFNHLTQPEFTRTDFLRWLTAVVRERGWDRVPETSLKRDVDCFIRTYVPSRPTRMLPLEDTLDCPLTELGLIREFGGRGNYMVERANWSTLPPELFAFALVTFMSRSGIAGRSVPLDSIAFAPGSPGRVFLLTEDAVLSRLEALSHLSRGALTFDETAGLRQLFMTSDLPAPQSFLESYYAGAARAEAQSVAS